MKKIILAMLLSFGLVQVAPVFAGDEGVKVKKVDRIKSYIKKHKVAFEVGASALAIGLAVACFNTHAGDKIRPAVKGVWKKKPGVEDSYGYFPGQLEGYSFHTNADISLYDEIVAPQSAIMEPYGKYEIAKMLPKLKGTLSTFVKKFNPLKDDATKWTDLNWTHVALDVFAVALIVDLGYNLITSKPELVELICNKVSSKLSRKQVEAAK